MQETNNANYSDKTEKKEKFVVQEETEGEILEENNDEMVITEYV